MAVVARDLWLEQFGAMPALSTLERALLVALHRAPSSPTTSGSKDGCKLAFHEQGRLWLSPAAWPGSAGCAALRARLTPVMSIGKPGPRRVSRKAGSIGTLRAGNSKSGLRQDAPLPWFPQAQDQAEAAVSGIKPTSLAMSGRLVQSFGGSTAPGAWDGSKAPEWRALQGPSRNGFLHPISRFCPRRDCGPRREVALRVLETKSPQRCRAHTGRCNSTRCPAL